MSSTTLVSARNAETTELISRDDPQQISRVDTTKEIFLPGDILERYISVAMRQAIPKQLENETWFSELPGFPGAWADGTSPKECLDTLAEVLRDWVILKVVDGDRDIPVIDEIDLNLLSHS